MEISSLISLMGRDFVCPGEGTITTIEHFLHLNFFPISSSSILYIVLHLLQCKTLFFGPCIRLASSIEIIPLSINRFSRDMLFPFLSISSTSSRLFWTSDLDSTCFTIKSFANSISFLVGTAPSPKYYFKNLGKTPGFPQVSTKNYRLSEEAFSHRESRNDRCAFVHGE